jgi:RNA polymerase sigma factor (sigma-70 family)
LVTIRRDREDGSMNPNFPTTSKTLMAKLARPEGTRERETAWVRFDNDYREPILKLCQRCGIGGDQQEDVYQEVMGKLHVSIEKFEPRRWLKCILERALGELGTEFENASPGSDAARIRDAMPIRAGSSERRGTRPSGPEPHVAGWVDRVLDELTREEQTQITNRWWEAGAAIWRDPRTRFDDLLRPALTRAFLKWGLEDPLAEQGASLLQTRINTTIATLGEETLPKFRGWLIRLVRNTAWDYRHRAQKWARRGDNRFAEFAGTASDPKDSYEELELRDLRLEASNRLRLAGVSDHDWKCFTRRIYDGLTTAEVAAELGMTVAAVGQAVYRVRIRMREELLRLEEPNPLVVYLGAS